MSAAETVIVPARRSALATMLKNALASLVRLASGWVLVLVVPPVLTRHLSRPEYSTWMLILQLAAYVTLVQGGVELAVSRYVARSDHTGEQQYVGRTLGAAVTLLAALGALLLLATIATSWELPRIFPEIPVQLEPTARTALLIVGGAYTLNLPAAVLSGLFQGYQKFEVTAVAAGVGRLVTAVGVMAAAVRGAGMVEMAVWAAAGVCLQSGLNFAWWQRTSRLTIAPLWPSREAVREFARFCAAILVVQFTTVIIAGLDLPIVAAFDFPASGYYAAALAAASVFAVPAAAVISSFLPVASGLTALRTPQEVGAVLMRATRYASALLCSLAVPALVFLHPLLRLWVGPAYADQAAPLTAILIVAQFVRLTLLPYAIVGFSAGQQNRMLASPLLEAAVNLGASLVAVHYLGARGVALGTLLGSAVGVVMHFAVSMKATTCVEVSRSRFFAAAIARPVLVSLPVATVAALLAPQARETSAALLGAAASAAAVAATHFWLTLDARERAELIALAPRPARIARETADTV